MMIVLSRADQHGDETRHDEAQQQAAAVGDGVDDGVFVELAAGGE